MMKLLIENRKKGSAVFAKIYILLVFIAVPLITYPSYPEEMPGARAASLGFSFAGLNDGWSLFHNQAELGNLENMWLGVHHENRFFSPELNFSALGFILPVKPGALGVSLKRLGFSQFSQTQTGLAYGMTIVPSFSAGIQLNMHNVYVAGEYGSSTAFSADLGLQYDPSKSLTIGMHVSNPTRSKISKDERIPTIVNLGLMYRFGEKVLLTSGFEKNIDADASIKAGVEYIPIEKLFFRVGVATNPSLICFGLGYQFGPVQADLAFSYHEYLGYTPHFSLSYIFKSKRSNSIAEDEML